MQSDAARAPNEAAPLRVLFIGNSYTYYNAMPKMLASLAAASKEARPVEVKEITEGAATLDKLWSYRSAKETLSSEKWDYVVLQDQSGRPISNPKGMTDAVREIDAHVRKAGARTLLYLTWARAGKPEMQTFINQTYARIAREIDALLAPVGPAWEIALKSDPPLKLHIADGSHPTPTGSYIAACTFFLIMTPAASACSPLQGLGVSDEDTAVAGESVKRAMALKMSDLLGEK